MRTALILVLVFGAIAASAEAAVPELVGTHLGTFGGPGVVYVVHKKNPGAEVTTYEAHMQVAQGGIAHFGARTPVTITVRGDKITIVRDAGGGRAQTAVLDNFKKEENRGGTIYQYYYSTQPVQGPGTDGKFGAELFIHPK